jgi:RNA polymerase sigma-70 factor, ECF subfamily
MATETDEDEAKRFRDLVLPHLGDAFALARYLLRDVADAEDAVQECYLRAFRHFRGFRGTDAKPWLLAILRNVCRGEHARRGGPVLVDGEHAESETALPMWCEDAQTPEHEVLRRLDASTLQRLIGELPEPFRETLVLREVSELDYRDIAEVVGVLIDTVMSRLARARAILRRAWLATEEKEG